MLSAICYQSSVIYYINLDAPPPMSASALLQHVSTEALEGQIDQRKHRYQLTVLLDKRLISKPTFLPRGGGGDRDGPQLLFFFLLGASKSPRLHLGGHK